MRNYDCDLNSSLFMVFVSEVGIEEACMASLLNICCTTPQENIPLQKQTNIAAQYNNLQVMKWFPSEQISSKTYFARALKHWKLLLSF